MSQQPAHLNLQPPALNGATENPRTENAAPSKMQKWKTRVWKTRHQCVGGAKCETEYYETPVTITDSGNVVRMITMNFYAHDSKISTRNLYSKWNVQIT